MFKFIKRFVSGRGSADARLSGEQAIAIAKQATADDPLSGLLSLTSFDHSSQPPRWIVHSATVGRFLIVTIDDATGEVVQIKRAAARKFRTR